MFDDKETQYKALSSWLTYRLDGWRTHRDINYVTKWDEYYRLWRGIWLQQDRMRGSEKSRIISPALQQAVVSASIIFIIIEFVVFYFKKWEL